MYKIPMNEIQSRWSQWKFEQVWDGVVRVSFTIEARWYDFFEFKKKMYEFYITNLNKPDKMFMLYYIPVEHLKWDDDHINDLQDAIVERLLPEIDAQIIEVLQYQLDKFVEGVGSNLEYDFEKDDIKTVWENLSIAPHSRDSFHVKSSMRGFLFTLEAVHQWTHFLWSGEETQKEFCDSVYKDGRVIIEDDAVLWGKLVDYFYPEMQQMVFMRLQEKAERLLKWINKE